MPFLFDLLPGLGLAVLAIIALLCTVVLRATLRLGRLRWRRVRTRTVLRDEIPDKTRLQLDQVAAALAAAGFEYRYSGAAERAIVLPGERWAFSDIYQHADGQTHAVVIPSQTPETRMPCVVQMVSCFDNGSNWMTVNCYRHNAPFTQPDWEVFDDYLSDFSEVFARHRQRIQTTGRTLIADGIEVRKRLMTASERLVPFLVRQRKLVALPERGRWHLSFKASLDLVLQVQRGQRRAAKAGNCVGPVTLSGRGLPVTTDAAQQPPQGAAELDIAAFEQQQALLRSAAGDKGAGGSRKKLGIFVLTAALFLLVGGFFFSWTFVPVLLAVVALHEGGHYLAMRLTGYQNVAVFFLPGLGGLATGEKAHASAFEKLFVFLAGPMPGIVLAVTALLLMYGGHFSPPEWFTGFLFACLVINYLNLLPITPLDGGRVLETFMFARFPALRFGFAALSCGLLFGLGWLLGDIVLRVIALLLVLGLPHQWRLMVANRAMRRSSDEALEEPAALRMIFSALQAPRFAGWSFARRVSVARSLLPELQGPRASPAKAVAGMLIYSICLFGPLTAAFVAMPQLGGVASMLFSMSSLEKDDVDDGAPPPPATADIDWAARLAQQSATMKPDELLTAQLGAARQASNTEDSEKARGHYLEAWKIAQARPAGDAQRLETLLELAQLSDSDQEARAYLQTVISDLAAPQGKQWLQLAQAKEQLARSTTPLPDRLLLLRDAVAHRMAHGAPDAHELMQSRMDLARVLDASGDAERAEAALRSRLDAIAAPDPADRSRQALERRTQRATASADIAWFLIAHARAPEARKVATTALADVPKKVSTSWLYPNQMLRESLLWAELELRDAAAIRQSWQDFEEARSLGNMGISPRPQLTHEADRYLVAQALGDSELAVQAQSGMQQAMSFFKNNNRQPSMCNTSGSATSDSAGWPDWRQKQRTARLQAWKRTGLCAAT